MLHTSLPELLMPVNKPKSRVAPEWDCRNGAHASGSLQNERIGNAHGNRPKEKAQCGDGPVCAFTPDFERAMEFVTVR